MDKHSIQKDQKGVGVKNFPTETGVLKNRPVSRTLR